MNKIFFAILFFCSSAFADCDQLVAWGFPVTPKATIPLCQIAYYVKWDSSTKNPAYSAEYLLEENVSGSNPRKGGFKPHPNIDEHIQASNDDYYKSNYDKGHLSPSADMRKDSVAMAQSFYLTNMIPQVPELNRKYWAGLESAVRGKVTIDRPLYVITGPIYEAPTVTIGNNVHVPSSTFKVIYDKQANTVATYIMPNVKTISGKLDTFYVPLEKVEFLSNMSMFPLIPANEYKTLKQKPLSSW